jgi:hypothetical protein
MTRLLLLLLTLLFSLSGPVMGGYSDFGQSSLAARTTLSPSAFARSQQGSFPYTGVDRFRDITLKKGRIIYGE